jgi:hypothetical protein
MMESTDKDLVHNKDLVCHKDDSFVDNDVNKVNIDTDNLVDTNDVVGSKDFVDIMAKTDCIDTVDGKVKITDDAMYNMNHGRRGLVFINSILQKKRLKI